MSSTLGRGNESINGLWRVLRSGELKKGKNNQKGKNTERTEKILLRASYLQRGAEKGTSVVTQTTPQV